MIDGYVRVNTNGQSRAAQKAALEAGGVEKLFSEKVSGGQAKRRQMVLCLGSLKEGDTLVVTRLDRLARSTRDLLNIVEGIPDAGAKFRSLDEARADTTPSTGRLMLTVLGGIAEFERDLILARTAEGRAQAKAAGKRLCRPFRLTPHQQAEVRERGGRGESVREIARSYNVSPSTNSRAWRSRGSRQAARLVNGGHIHILQPFAENDRVRPELTSPGSGMGRFVEEYRRVPFRSVRT